MTKSRYFYLLFYTVLFWLTDWLGAEMTIDYSYFQLLDAVQLQNNLGQSLLYLHSQPPLMNFILGLALKFQALTGISAQLSLLCLHFLMGGLIIFCLDWLAVRFVANKYARIAFMLLVLLNPMFYSFLFLYFYTIHELLLLSLLFGFIYRFYQNPRLQNYLAICLIMLGLVYTRTLFHFGWAFIILGGLLLTNRRFWLQERRKSSLVLAGTAVLLLLWPMKNYLLFGFFSTSSWQGYNLSRGIPLSETVSIDTLFKQADPQRDVPENFHHIQTVHQIKKSDGSLNWNYYPLIAYGQHLQEETLNLIWEKPQILGEKATTNYTNRYVIYSGRNPYDGLYDRRSTATPPLNSWVSLYETVLFHNVKGVPSFGDVNVFFFLFPIIMLLSLIKIARSWCQKSAEIQTIWWIWLTIMWVLLMILFVDGVEANRIRFSTEPFLFLLAAWLIPNFRRGE